MFSTVRAGWSAKFERENSIWQWDDGFAVGRKRNLLTYSRCGMMEPAQEHYVLHTNTKTRRHRQTRNGVHDGKDGTEVAGSGATKEIKPLIEMKGEKKM